MKNYDLSNIDILYIEKHPNMRAMMKMVLREMGIRYIRDTSDPGIAYDMFKGHPSDIIVVDWAPGLNGIEFLDNVRGNADSPNRYVPVIIVTANTERQDVFTARDHGMTEFLSKPFSARKLYDRISTVIETARPFVNCDTYFGPDRRRRNMEFDGDDRRKVTPKEEDAPEAKA